MVKYRTVEKPDYDILVDVQRKCWFGWKTIGSVAREKADKYVHKLLNPVIKEYS